MIIKVNFKLKKLKSKNQLSFKNLKLKHLLSKDKKKELLIILKRISVLHMNKLFLNSNNKNFRREFKKLISLKLYKSQIMRDLYKIKMLS